MEPDVSDPVITNQFPKQPRETIWVPVSFSDLLSELGDTARAFDPIELDTVPTGITVDSQVFDPATSVFRVLVSGGTDGQSYLLTMWINTTSGERREHEITIKVKEKS
jgi:hypothetical protein